MTLRLIPRQQKHVFSGHAPTRIRPLHTSNLETPSPRFHRASKWTRRRRRKNPIALRFYSRGSEFENAALCERQEAGAFFSDERRRNYGRRLCQSASNVSIKHVGGIHWIASSCYARIRVFCLFAHNSLPTEVLIWLVLQ